MKARYFSFVRHGKVEGPAALYGKTDIASSIRGRQELIAGLERLHQETPIDFIFSSPLQRCAQTAEEFATHHLLPIFLEPDLQECDFGDWDGVDFNALQNQWPALEKFWQSPLDISPPQGENLQTFYNRINTSWQDIQTQQYCDHTLILCHGGTIRMVLAALLKIPLESPLFAQLRIDYCSHTRIEVSDAAGAKPIVRWIGAPL
ncbi:alpha-ribazole phosphatase [Cellvibrio zantedeschiae]|uniref:Alpha-ribazole phosphatase n=1 Tax=Cellvibrio zantedeschiae TaxID=1237077 RepID=A0ABQ3B266_9GAMM|nr:histidine phosphatase family protein [Cellvibrio zantedeschiae]GGY74571.1 alpha-ribazole phosphatase [Cellvibrio zantedeschiae]